MPARDPQAMAMMQAAEVRAEQTVSVLRMVLALVLAVTLLLALGGRPEGDSRFSPIDIQVAFALATLGAYFLVGLVSLLASRSRRYRPWMAWVFAALDMAFLFFNTLTTIENLGVTGNYVAAFPVAWLVPVLLVYGVLRYDPWLQVFTGVGVMAALFAAGTVAAEFRTTAAVAPEHLDRLFDAPPNIVRFAMVACAVLVLVLAVQRNRRRLLAAIEDARSRAYLTRYLPPRIAEWLTGPEAAAARAGRHQPVAVMFVDIRGFTRLAEGMDPGELSALLNRYRTHVSDTVDAHGGVVDKFIGDGALCVFGVPNPSPQDADHALACGHALLAAVADLNRRRDREPVAIGIGVHYGDVWCGTIGDDRRIEFTVLGDTVNVASRLEQATKEQMRPMLMSRAVVDALTDPGGAPPHVSLGRQVLRGRDEVVEVFAVTPPSA